VEDDPTSIRREVIDLLRGADRAPDRPTPGGASEDELDELEARIGATLPPQLRQWLAICKGEAIAPGGVFGVRPDEPALDIGHRLSVHDPLRGWLPVAGDGNGDVYVLVTDGPLAGRVAFIDQADPDEIACIVASDLWLFLRFLLRREAGERGWPFDLTMVTAADPGMANVPNGLRPWA
jgi:cell wall assembly regulator SMI1